MTRPLCPLRVAPSSLTRPTTITSSPMAKAAPIEPPDVGLSTRDSSMCTRRKLHALTCLLPGRSSNFTRHRPSTPLRPTMRPVCPFRATPASLTRPKTSTASPEAKAALTGHSNASRPWRRRAGPFARGLRGFRGSASALEAVCMEEAGPLQSELGTCTCKNVRLTSMGTSGSQAPRCCFQSLCWHAREQYVALRHWKQVITGSPKRAPQCKQAGATMHRDPRDFSRTCARLGKPRTLAMTKSQKSSEASTCEDLYPLS
mmetsp:Transcript_28275/g.81125  ORF Transcript_28275/g.81125 Transcript_28275/m.81125 type:complete len:259 (-) Transcript_28275:101-877(-)